MLITKNTHKRLMIFLVSLITFLIIFKFLFNTLKSNTIYFFSPSEISKLTKLPDKKIRLGGMVKKNSITENRDKYEFIITDFNQEISVVYSGILPNLFVEGQGAVVEGKLVSRKYFVGTKILAKHDENYMPKEVADSLEQINSFKKNK